MNTEILKYIIFGTLAIFAIVVIAYLILMKKMGKSEYRQMKKLQEGTKADGFSSDIMYQKIYITLIKTPFLKRYLFKLRRRLEIVNIDDEYTTRKESAKILTKAMLIFLLVAILTILITHNNWLLMSILLIFELFIVDTMVEGMVDKIDNNLLKEQIDFFAEIRHAYHEYNMVEEAIYQVSLDDEKSVSKQGEKIYEILSSDDPETELEKYYDVAPNAYLKEFAGVSYLTKEFGDRKVNGASLYLKNVNNITQEMQLEILKRDKLNYVFQSLSVISILPMMFLEAIKNWSVSQFSFTESFYMGRKGMLVQILVLLITFICYTLTRKLKDNGSTNMNVRNTENPWQAKVYKIPFLKKIIDLFIPKEGTKEYRVLKEDLKNAASKDKMEWVYVNRLTLCIVTFFVSVFIFAQLHQVEIRYIYTEPTTEFDLVGTMNDKQKRKAMEITESDNQYLDFYRGNTEVQQKDIEKIMKNGRINKDYVEATNEEVATAAKRVLDKLHTVNKENLQWFEILLGMVFAMAAYMAPVWLLKFQAKMRQLEMEDEVMQFQTIILMLMRIERVNVEIILEWLERYANIFKEPISKCVNNFESGAWEALEQLKEDVNYPEMIRLVESMQAAVEKIPITDAFDELDTERDYYQARRKESNERLISKKGLIGRVIGFTPMIGLFVCYLIVPLVVIGLSAMKDSFNAMSAMK